MSSLNFPKNITYNSNKITDFDSYMNAIIQVLEITQDDGQNLKNEINQMFTENDKLKIIDNKIINTHVNVLLTNDADIIKLKDDYRDFFNKIEDRWNKMTLELGKLQALILLSQVKKKDCSMFINKLIQALDTKMITVNTILDEHIKVKLTDNKNNKKYLKYKNKYLNLKKYL